MYVSAISVYDKCMCYMHVCMYVGKNNKKEKKKKRNRGKKERKKKEIKEDNRTIDVF